MARVEQNCYVNEWATDNIYEATDPEARGIAPWLNVPEGDNQIINNGDQCNGNEAEDDPCLNIYICGKC